MERDNVMKRTERASERGTFIVPAVVVIFVIAALSYGFLTVTVSTNRDHQARAGATKVLYVAEAGTNVGAVALLPGLPLGQSKQLGSPDEPIPFGDGSYWVEAQSHSDGTYTLLSHATHATATVTVETKWHRALHPIRDHAIFSGNLGEDPTHDLEFGGSGREADVINGKVYSHGDVTVTGDAVINADVTATGQVFGNVNGEVKQNAPKIDPPDLAAMKYDEIADFKIDSTGRYDTRGRLPRDDPRHIFVKEFRDDLATSKGFKFDNTNYFFGDPYEDSDLTKVSVPAAGNKKVYFVDGNLWVEPQGTTQSIIKSPPEGTVITVVVRGNIYLSDTLRYDAAKDGILFIALTDGESYNDLNGNNQYDTGEPLLHDDGDGVYEGPAEGSGNIHFGDPNGGPLGHVQSFMYADNHFEDHVLDGTGSKPLPFEVTGFMSAGEEVRIKRDFGTGHAKMRVNYDRRIIDGRLDFPGFPAIGGHGELGLLSWRVVGSSATLP
jgi:hypothetical protein